MPFSVKKNLNYDEVTRLLGAEVRPLDYKQSIHTIFVDLPRSKFIIEENHSLQHFKRAWLNCSSDSNYSQDLMNGGTFTSFFPPFTEESTGLLRLGYLDDNDILCSFCVQYAKESPDKWMAYFLRNVNTKNKTISIMGCHDYPWTFDEDFDDQDKEDWLMRMSQFNSFLKTDFCKTETTALTEFTVENQNAQEAFNTFLEGTHSQKIHQLLHDVVSNEGKMTGKLDQLVNSLVVFGIHDDKMQEQKIIFEEIGPERYKKYRKACVLAQKEIFPELMNQFLIENMRYKQQMSRQCGELPEEYTAACYRYGFFFDQSLLEKIKRHPIDLLFFVLGVVLLKISILVLMGILTPFIPILAHLMVQLTTAVTGLVLITMTGPQIQFIEQGLTNHNAIKRQHFDHVINMNINLDKEIGNLECMV